MFVHFCVRLRSPGWVQCDGVQGLLIPRWSNALARRGAAWQFAQGSTCFTGGHLGSPPRAGGASAFHYIYIYIYTHNNNDDNSCINDNNDNDHDNDNDILHTISVILDTPRMMHTVIYAHNNKDICVLIVVMDNGNKLNKHIGCAYDIKHLHKVQEL